MNRLTAVMVQGWGGLTLLTLATVLLATGIVLS
jgi:hypothetical protein